MIKMFKRSALYPISILAAVLASGCAGMGSNVETKQYVFNQSVSSSASDSGRGATSRNVLYLYRAPGASEGSMKIVGSIVDSCLSGTLDVKIEQTPTALLLLPQKKMPTCYDTRITIRTDGSGGFVERRGTNSADFAIAIPGYDWGLRPL